MKKSSIYYRSLYYVFLMVIFMVLGYMFFVSGIDTKTKTKTKYQSNSDVIYNINYEENIVKDININYKYNSIFSKKIDGYYKYNVLAYLYAYQDSVEDIIWFRKYELSDDKIVNINNNDSLEIRDNLRLDFDEYQHVLDKFNEDEQLDAFGYLNIKINVIEYLDVNSEINNHIKDRVININIPINNNPMINVDNVDIIDSYYDLNRHSVMNFVLVTISMICFFITTILFLLVIRQFKLINDRQTKYSRHLEKVLNDYDYCIVKVNKLYVNKKYNMIYVSSFDELLDVYVSRNKMISFKEVHRGMESIFVILDSNDAWIYRLTADNVEEGR